MVEEALEGRGEQVKESVVAAEVFGRSSSFDSRTDSVVRVEARNLRARLHEYYLGEGVADPVVIELPKGTYVPVFHEGTNDGAGAASLVRRRWRLIGAVVLAALALAGAWWLAFRRPWFEAGRSTSVAVLPFLNLAGGPDDQYFADGFVEDLTTDLGSRPGLRVAARTSAFQFRGKSEDVREIGRRLGVGAVLEGSLRRQGEQVKITVQLIDTRNGYHMWAQTYERNITGVDETEREIGREVAQTLGVAAAAGAGSRHAPLPEAREAYWRGRYLRGNWQDPTEAVRYFERAVALDPEYAEAWAALASLHSGLAFQAVGSVDAEASKARAAAQKALSLDQTVAEAYITLAAIGYSYDYDWPASERAFRRALALNRNLAGAHRAYALALAAHARSGEAIAQIQAAQELDPLSIVATNNLAVTYYLARRYEEGVQAARHHLEMDPQFFPARIVVGDCRVQQGRLKEGVEELEKGTAQADRPIEFLGDLGYALARGGRLADAAAIEAELRSNQKGRNLIGVAMAKIATGRGEWQQAVEWLRQAADAHVANVTFVGVEPAFDALRPQPTFQALCARLGLPAGH